MGNRLKSYEIVSIAVFLLGGDSRFVDTEDIAVKANELAPGLFTWQKYKDQISFDHVRRKLTEATTKESGSLLVGSVRRGWQLTRAGVEFARKEQDRLGTDRVSSQRLDGKAQMRLRLERERMKASKAYQKYKFGGIDDITIEEANTFFRVDEYVPANIREGKILRLENNFADDAELGELVKFLSILLKGENKHV